MEKQGKTRIVKRPRRILLLNVTVHGEKLINERTFDIKITIHMQHLKDIGE